MSDLSRFEVPHRGRTMTVKMDADEAEMIYGDDAKRVGDVEPAKPQPITEPPYAEPVPAPGESDPATGEKRASARRNKARPADADKA